MGLITNPYLEELEKKHPKAFFVISLILSIILLSIGLCLLFTDACEKAVSILMIVMGALGIVSTALLKMYNKTDIHENYKEHRGILVKKYRDFVGRYVFVIDEKEILSKVYVGKMLFEKAELGTKWTVGEINRKLIGVRSEISKNKDW